MSNIDHEHLLAYFHQVSHTFWIRHWKDKAKYHNDSFKVSYNFKKGFGHGMELWYIEENLLDDINKKEKK